MHRGWGRQVWWRVRPAGIEQAGINGRSLVGCSHAAVPGACLPRTAPHAAVPCAPCAPLTPPAAPPTHPCSHGICFDGTSGVVIKLVEAFWNAGKVVSGEAALPPAALRPAPTTRTPTAPAWTDPLPCFPHFHLHLGCCTSALPHTLPLPTAAFANGPRILRPPLMSLPARLPVFSLQPCATAPVPW